jgi:hypothetical protein
MVDEIVFCLSAPSQPRGCGGRFSVGAITRHRDEHGIPFRYPTQRHLLQIRPRLSRHPSSSEIAALASSRVATRSERAIGPLTVSDQNQADCRDRHGLFAGGLLKGDLFPE